MIYKIENKKMKITLKNEIMELPIKLKEEINKNFENMKKNLLKAFPVDLWTNSFEMERGKIQ